MKTLALRLMRASGIFSLTRALSARQARALMYHNFCGDEDEGKEAVSVSAALTQFEYLRRHYRVVPLSHLVERVKSDEPLERGMVALTVDDGRRNFYEVLFPLLTKLELPATFFVVSSFIRGEDWIWTDKVLWLSEQPTRPVELSPERIDHFFQKLNLLGPEARDKQIGAISKQMSVPVPRTPPAKYAPCSWNELREMADSGLVEIGSHTVGHPILSSITDEECWKELTVSRQQIEEGMGRKVNLFCFPNGTSVDFRSSQVALVRDAGYTSAVLATFGLVNHGTDVYRLPRIGVAGSTDDLIFAKHLDGVEYYQARLQKLLRPGNVSR